MKAGCPTIVIAGTGSGVGKTSLSLGLARTLRQRGIRVQTFKVGPDFLDPSYLAMASGRACYNLDGWMTSREYVRRLVARATSDADIAVVEGVMGLFDGISPSTLEASTAEIAGWLDAPVLLVVNAHGAARSLAATVQGFARFEPGVHIAGVIANLGGSPRHREVLDEALRSAALPPLVGLVPRDALPSLPSRHLGLVAADQSGVTAALLDELAGACQRHLDCPRIVELARSSCGFDVEEAPQPEKQPTVRLGIARDDAFHFYYPDNLEAFAEQGVEWMPFSPLADPHLPADLDGLYFGGGYPELAAEALAANRSMLADVERFASSGRCVYAECGGLMYLGRSITTLDGTKHAMAGVLPIETAMLQRLKTLGYTEVALAADSLWGPAGTTCRGHEFHYSELRDTSASGGGWQPAYSARRRGAVVAEGFAKGNVLASYVHLHWASRPELARSFLAQCRARETRHEESRS